ncbi:MAG: N-6 DNA methylase [Phycisphaerae bacterium]|nr:N-6 DNA methylase [Phycisphaerae bacterium]
MATIQVPAGDVRSEVVSCRELGAPLVIAITPQTLELWTQHGNNAELAEQIPHEKAEAFFRKRAGDLAPEAVFRAKTWGRLDQQFQLSFVDAGLMPVVEREIGERLTGLIERVVHNLRRSLWPRKSDVSVESGHWLLKSVFWLLAAKILQDKRVPGFITLDFGNVEDVFAKVARHYDSRDSGSRSIDIVNPRQQRALEAAADEIHRFSHLGHVTTESLAHVYESALITSETRAALGTHSTPQYLVDYLVWKLAPWIQEIPEDERDVFEPACGHAAFLVAAMRLLKELLPPERQADRKQYLRKHLHGVEIDSFAVEIARLSLTLADIPNPNGWDLVCSDMFTGSLLTNKAQQASVLLGNPPFEDFSRQDREGYSARGAAVAHINKTAEVLSQVLPQLRMRGVFGFVVPQGILYGTNASDLRHLLCEQFELKEICLFPDKVFSFSDADSAILMGRRVRAPRNLHAVSYRRVREWDMDAFRLDYSVSTWRNVSQQSICSSSQAEFVLPDLPEVWRYTTSLPHLQEFAEVGEGLSYRSSLSKKILRSSAEPFPVAVRGFMRLGRSLQTHAHPPEVWLNISPEVMQPARLGADRLPQILLNHARASRGPWRIKAIIDREGHAFTNNFNAIRPRDERVSLEFLWALLNSPLANAFAYTHARSRHNLPGILERMPMPAASKQLTDEITRQVVEYHRTAKGQSSSASEKLLLMAVRLDALVLKAYDLPPQTERQLLDLFAGHRRVGVPYRLDRYFPAEFEPRLHLYEYLSAAFKGSTADSILAAHRTFESPEVSEALRRATEDFEEDE